MEVSPSYHGYIETNTDALLLAQAILDGKLKPVSRRPYEIERPQLIISGNVFVFIEEKSGIKRWTDGVSWSPSRIMGKFLVYRELDKQNSSLLQGHAGQSGRRKNSDVAEPLQEDQRNPVSKALVGSLNSSYAFKPGGLVKKTMSLKLKRASHVETIHIISYYTAEDVESGKLLKPSGTPFFKQLQPCRELILALDSSSVGNSRNASSNMGSSNQVVNVSNVPVLPLCTQLPGAAVSSYINPPIVQPIVNQSGYQGLGQLTTHHHHQHHHHHHQQLSQASLQGQAHNPFYSHNYYPGSSQHNPNAPLYHSYSYYTQNNPNMHLSPDHQHLSLNKPHDHQHQQQPQQPQEQVAQRRPHTGSAASATDISQLANASVASAPSSLSATSSPPHGQFAALPLPGSLFAADQQKQTGIQLPLPFPQGSSASAPPSASALRQPPPQQHAPICPKGTAAGYAPYPGYNMQQYVQTPPIYPVSRYGISSAAQLSFAPHMVSPSAQISPLPQQVYAYPLQHENPPSRGSASGTHTTVNADTLLNFTGRKTMHGKERK
ncbi:ADL010Wp [Eremothecium gossypii ATCC 10895]|uniref:ADL010Wp n=1 Tax=Eremothecium gossypii (strain ATCC 10895 / CBS 109.51 / FGSC 9923 / NRRL Y-1056) TaxID=284811 RepID=Q75AC7_EREGS|nr:ADL010Wp [Eremothecium gossypii ATCC 10895]AAS51911.1 ADL010Wp [Eremothecium gossypii ATCC 10895]AEY96210.1 FADL010Wp [Eremothecium gossypii FDAG1]